MHMHRDHLLHLVVSELSENVVLCVRRAHLYNMHMCMHMHMSCD